MVVGCVGSTFAKVQIKKVNQKPEFILLIKSGAVGVMPTDTVYGLVASANIPQSVERMYKIKKRNPKKPFVILIGDMAQLKMIGIKLDDAILSVAKKYWPGAVSLILPCEEDRFEYLHRGLRSVAVRLPADASLREILMQTGPIATSSANLENDRPADNLEKAKKYFLQDADTMLVPDFFIDGGLIKRKPSTIIRIDTEGLEEIVRD